MNAQDTPELLTLEETAELLRLSESTVRRLHEAGKLPRALPGVRRQLFRREDILRLLDGARVETRSTKRGRK